MVDLSKPQDFRDVQTLPFCYVCGRGFLPGERTDRDHVPSRKVFHPNHREPPLLLRTHWNCNNGHSGDDKKVGHLIGRKWGKATSDRSLEVTVFGPDRMAITNLNIRANVLRWVCAFHAALYREPLTEGSFERHLVTPFPTAPRPAFGQPTIFPLLPQHEAFVHTIKEQRALRNLDTITANRGKLRYECIWTQFDRSDDWLCVFALDLYGWKDLGRTAGQPQRGCAGFYRLLDRPPPETATRKRRTPLVIPNIDTLDAFAT